jgi:hypothetical protein
MAFLDDLGSSLSDSLTDQIGLADSTPGNLDSSIGPVRVPFGKLGDFASKIDKSAHRQYIESGSIRNIRPRAMEIISQQPDMTILIKKRLFSSLMENYKLDLLDADELLFVRATKALFERKCKAIGSYERLSKFQNIVSKNDGVINDYALPGIFNAFDALEASGPSSLFTDGKTKSTIDTIRKLKAFSDPNFFTTWLDDSSIPFATPKGRGTGVIELTTVSSFSSKVSTEFGQGNASLTIEDPYKLMIVSDEDIEQAIAEATNLFSQNSFFTLTKSNLESSIDMLKSQLAKLRRARGVPNIRFIFSEETILFKKVRAIIDEEGREINFTFDAGSFGLDIFSFDPDTVSLEADATQGVNGLSDQEADLFKRIINDSFILNSLHQTTRSEIKEFNKETNKVRKKMRLHYANKPIIQPMDVVYIFVGSKTINDPMISQGLKNNFAKDSLLNTINDTIGNIESQLNDIVNTFSGGTAGSNYIENEKNAIAGPNFPMWLWNLMRNDFTKQSAGSCVFVGIVNSTSHSYSGGKYTLSVSVNDNAHYFNKGTMNISPSVEVFNSALYDPLTPFKLDFEESSGFLRGEVPELLDINRRLLNSNSIRAKMGRFKGTAVDEEKYYKMDVEQVASSFAGASGNRAEFGRQFRRKFTDPDGFVYRWKEGIGSLVLFGEPYSNLATLGSFKSETSPVLTKNPFVGQDTMNVLSLLITGQPYNFNNFMRGALQHNQINRDDLFNETMSATFFKGLIGDITRNNSIWGNFVPFKKLVVNEREYAFLATGEFDMINRQRKVTKLVKRRAEVFDQLSAASEGIKDTAQFYQIGVGGDVNTVADTSVAGIAALGDELNKLDVEIGQFTSDFANHIQPKNIQSAQGTLQIIGDDISFDPTLTDSEGENTETKTRIERSELRKKVNYLTQRRLWKVKGNEDQNLFVVDDTYDKNYDIQQFEQALSGQMEKFQSNYTNVFEQISVVKQILGLEVFADSQGHIRARPPQYNRMPSSVFHNMLNDKAEKGIKIFPDYLESLFFTTIKGIADQLEIIEDQIRLRAAALGKVNDVQARGLLAGTNGGKFVFLTQESGDGKFGGVDVRSLLEQNAPDLTEQTSSKALNAINTKVSSAVNATINFDIVKRIDFASLQSNLQPTNLNDIQTRIDQISTRLKEKTKNPNIPSSVSDIFSNKRIQTVGARSQADTLRVTSEIAQYLAERQRLLKRLAPAVANLREGLSVNAKDSSTARAVLLPNLNRKPDKLFPEILESMIEDENDHDLGVNSGQRYILTDAKIISLDITETEPAFNSIQVDGKLGLGLVPQTSGLETGNGGNAIGTAWAIDYDLWQMYGLRQENPVNVPFLQDPNTQCAPYAVFLLNLARKQIFKAQCQVIGNEFIQAGEVYYIEDRDLLFYANSVSHSFGFNSQFTTTLDLTFGHNPGEYIPTQLDIIGKGLYTNRHQADLVRQVRHNRADDSRALSVVTRDVKQPVGIIPSGTTNNVKALLEGTFGEQNKKNLGNIMLATTGLLTPTTFDRVMNIEIRTYKNSEFGLDASPELAELVQSISAWLGDPRSVSIDGEDLLPATNRPLINQERIIPEVIDLSTKIKDDRSPSSMAWTMARTITNSSDLSYVNDITAVSEQNAKEGNDVAAASAAAAADAVLARKDVEALINNVIDIWIAFSDPTDTAEGSKGQGDAQSQAQQEEDAKVAAAEQAKVDQAT